MGIKFLYLSLLLNVFFPPSPTYDIKLQMRWDYGDHEEFEVIPTNRYGCYASTYYHDKIIEMTLDDLNCGICYRGNCNHTEDGNLVVEIKDKNSDENDFKYWLDHVVLFTYDFQFNKEISKSVCQFINKNDAADLYITVLKTEKKL